MKKKDTILIVAIGTIAILLVVALFVVSAAKGPSTGIGAMIAGPQNQAVYDICMKTIYHRNKKACTCVSNKAVWAFPEIQDMTKQQVWEKFMMFGEWAARSSLYLNAELPCLPVYTREKCNNDPKYCKCKISFYKDNMEVMQDALSKVYAYEEGHQQTYYMAPLIKIENDNGGWTKFSEYRGKKVPKIIAATWHKSDAAEEILRQYRAKMGRICYGY